MFSAELPSRLLTRQDSTYLPNAIGGRRTVIGLICTDCNSVAGAKWDAALAERLGYFSSSLDIARQRGKVPPLTIPTLGGDSVRIYSDGRMTSGKPHVEKTSEGSTTRFDITAPTRKELRNVVKSLCRRYPQLYDLDIDGFIAQAHDVSSYSSDVLQVDVTFGGPDAGRSLIKTAVSLVCDAGVDVDQCDIALSYLVDENMKPCFSMFYDSSHSLVVDRPSQRVFHVAYVRGNSADSTLVGYIELYSWMRVVICLSESYSDRDFEHVYAIDPTSGEELQITVDLDSSISLIREAWQSGLYSTEVLSDAVSDTLDIAQEFNFLRARERIIEKAVDKAFANSGVEEGARLSDEQTQRAIRDIAGVVVPFIVHNMNRGEYLRGSLRQDDD